MTYLYSAIIGISLAASLLVWESRPLPPQPDPAAAQAFVPSNPRESAAVALLTALGNAQPTSAIIGAVVEWSIAEDGGDGAMARNNPWNTTQPGFAENATINSDGVKGYATMEDGIAATAHTLTNGLYEPVVAALLANDPEVFKQALWVSPWAASHYGGGAQWPVYQAAITTTAPQAKCLPTSTGAISAHFSDTSSGYWSAQFGGMHNGTDFSGAQGEPVYAPFGMRVEDIQYYGDPGRIGWYVQGRLNDGWLYYSGHLGTVGVRVGEDVAACQQIGTIGEVFHTHVKIASPDKPVPCEATGCDDFERYYEEH